MTLTTWYYEKDGKAEGPVSESVLLDLIAKEEINKNTLVWQKPMKEWAKASSIESLKEKFTDVPPPLPDTKTEQPSLPVENSPFVSAVSPTESSTLPWIPKSTGSESDKKYPGELIIDGISQVRPWPRFFARQIDYAIYGLCLGGLLLVLSSDLMAQHTPETTQDPTGSLLTILLSFALTTLLWGFIQAIITSLTGTTFGKYVFGIMVLDSEGKLLRFESAIRREIYVWIYGLGFGVPIINLLTMAMGYDHLKNYGITSWDNRCNTTVEHKATRTLLLILIIIIASPLVLTFIAGFVYAFIYSN